MTFILSVTKLAPIKFPMRSGSLQFSRGFTLIELLVVLSILALLITIATPRYFNGIDQTKESVLRQDLNILRESIDKFYADKGTYPDSLEDLVTHEYIKKIPIDPITESTETWLTTAPEPPLEGGVFDVHSGAEGAGKDGTPFSQW